MIPAEIAEWIVLAMFAAVAVGVFAAVLAFIRGTLR